MPPPLRHHQTTLPDGTSLELILEPARPHANDYACDLVTRRNGQERSRQSTYGIDAHQATELGNTLFDLYINELAPESW